MRRARLVYRALLATVVLTLTACQQGQMGPIATGAEAASRVEFVTTTGV